MFLSSSFFESFSVLIFFVDKKILSPTLYTGGFFYGNLLLLPTWLAISSLLLA